jgi:hypothetical protein
MKIMRLQRIAVLFCTLSLLLIGTPAAFADDPCTNHGNGEGEGNGNPCHEVPEASHSLLYAGAGFAVVAGFAAVAGTRRHRTHPRV